MNDADLLAAIRADSAASALAASGDDAGCAARLAAILSPVAARYIPARTLIYWGAVTGTRARIQHASADDTSPIQSLAISYMDLIRDSNNPGLDTADPAIVGTGGLLDAFVAAGVFAASGTGSKADLIAQAPMSPASVAAGDVSRVMLPSRPGGKVNN